MAENGYFTLEMINGEYSIIHAICMGFGHNNYEFNDSFQKKLTNK